MSSLRRDATVETCTFLELPAELRSEIYKLVLPEGDENPVHLSPRGIDDPAMLLTCKRIRHEGVQIYYGKRKFTVPVIDYDPVPLLKWSEKQRAIKKAYQVTPAIESDRETAMQRNWPNLHLWLKYVHQRRIAWYVAPPSQYPENEEELEEKLEAKIVGTMFHVAKTLRNQPWEMVDGILQEHHHLLDRRWE